MGRAPCCEKMGLKRGPWTPEEDRILIDHINTYGHANWRALPKQAGLLRCGKSCRLRWTNYLRPDIKRGNLTREEEDAIINLHEMLGNRWSAIAARLPGRTDNEIKNVWHTHLKKRLPQNKQGAHNNNNNNNPKRNNKKQTKLDIVVDASKSNQDDKQEEDDDGSQSPQQCSSDMSSLSTSSDNNHEHHNNNSNSSSSSIATTTNNNNHDMSINNDNDDGGGDSAENNLALDEDFWMEVLSCDNNSSESTTTTSGVLDSNISDGADYRVQVPFSPVLGSEEGVLSGSSLSMCDEMDFWYDVYSRAEDISELLEL